ncbi:MAG: DUF5658 family protein [Chloroflexi bacterium]|nr:DUF5658 family protein [Chloroflexota bacterium]
MQHVIKVQAAGRAGAVSPNGFVAVVRSAFSTRTGELSRGRIILASYFVLFQLLDLVITQVGLSLGIVEANGLASGILGAAGRPGMALFKLAITAIVLLLLVRLSVSFRRIWAAVWIADVLMTMVFAFNMLNIWLFVVA